MTDPYKSPNGEPKPDSGVAPPPTSGLRAVGQAIFSKRMLVVLLQGFSCGVPLLLTTSLMQAWLTDECVSIEHISLFGLVMLPYTLKFLWAPFLDRYAVPFFGRRRGWLAIFQVCLAGSIMLLGQNDPLNDPWLLALSALILVFFAASQDIVVDAHRRESLADHELGLGSSFYVQAYRFGMIAASGYGLVLADQYGFEVVYFVMGLLILVGVISTLIASEPPIPSDRPTTLRAAVIEPFKEFFTRRDAWLILLFVLLYKFGDAMAGHLTMPFFLDYGYTKTEIGVVVKLFGFFATLVGAIVGAIIMIRIGLFRALVAFGIFQMVSTLGFTYMSVELDQKKFNSVQVEEQQKAERNAKKVERDAAKQEQHSTLSEEQMSKAVLLEKCVPNSIQEKLASKAEREKKRQAEREALLATAAADKESRFRLILLAIVITIENLAAGMGTAAFLAFMASMANKRFTATQYALLTSFMAFSANVLNAPGGYVVKAVGWEYFFAFCTIIAIPGLLLLWRFRSWIGREAEPIADR